jgi:hypothetical protein
MRKSMHAVLLAGSLFSTSVMADTLEITLTNLTNGTYFTPLLVAAHPKDVHLFEPGVAASAHLQAMAEGGDISGLISDMAAIGANTVENPAGGLLAPGSTTTLTLHTGRRNKALSITAMLLPTNDGFVGLDALPLPRRPGTYTYTLNGYDAGTEVNDEIVNGGGTPGVPGIPADPGGANGSGATGAAQFEANTVVHIHPGVLGDDQPSGGPSDLDRSVHRWLNPVAKLVITVKKARH